MSTAAVRQSSITRSRFATIVARFVWKEYRALRALWIAVVLLGLFVQWLVGHLLRPDIDWATIYFMIALSAAALYAVGVASTTFSMEHENETYGYIVSLPTSWPPLFIGKQVFTVASAIALACVLWIVGWVASGFDTPGGFDTPFALGVCGFAMVEAIAWGTLFSLLFRQPLLAALLAIAAQSISLALMANAFGLGALPSTRIDTYYNILPQRAVVAIVVLVIDVFLARRWLTVDGTAVRAASYRPNSWARWSIAGTIVTRMRALANKTFFQRAGLRIFSHLLWQSCRQSWAIMFATIGAVMFVCASLLLLIAPTNWLENFAANENSITLFALTMLAAAVYASTVFYADQRGQKYRFLAEHAAWPRLVWLTRLLVWLLPILLAASIVAVLFAFGTHRTLQIAREQIGWVYQANAYWDARYASQQLTEAKFAVEAYILAFWTVAVGFAVGQACSMFFRRALVAGLASALLTAPLLVWCIAIWVWEISYTLFLLPIIFGLLLATWIRIKDWMVDRNHSRSWLKVATALLLPLLPFVWMLPAARLDPIESQPFTTVNLAFGHGYGSQDEIKPKQVLNVPAIVAGWARSYEADLTPAERATGERLIRLAESIDRIEQAYRDPTPAEMAEYHRRLVASNPAIIREATKLSRQKYRFPQFEFRADREQSPTDAHLSRLVSLLMAAGSVSIDDGDLEAALNYLFAALQLSERVADAQPPSSLSGSSFRPWFQQSLVSWANADGQTSERILRAIGELDAIYPPISAVRPTVPTPEEVANTWTPPAGLMADYLAIRDIILGIAPSHLLNASSGISEYAAVAANELSFERERALLVLDYIVLDQAARYRDLAWRLDQKCLFELTHNDKLKWGEDGPQEIADGLLSILNRAMDISDGDYYNLGALNRPYTWLRTTPLLRDELSFFGPFARWLDAVVNTQIAGWGLRQQLALIAYRLDHGRYPDKLAELVPTYLTILPLDPFTLGLFKYKPHGVPLELFHFSGGSAALSPNTPFLWSVGARHGRLRKAMTFEAVDPAAEFESSFDKNIREFYEFDLEPSNWGDGAPLVFPLPIAPSIPNQDAREANEER